MVALHGVPFVKLSRRRDVFEKAALKAWIAARTVGKEVAR
jgi:hypothetical protein